MEVLHMRLAEYFLRLGVHQNIRAGCFAVVFTVVVIHCRASCIIFFCVSNDWHSTLLKSHFPNPLYFIFLGIKTGGFEIISNNFIELFALNLIFFEK